MDESEVDQWYQEKKEQLSQRMQNELLKGKDPQKAKARFSQDLNKLIKEMQARQSKAVQRSLARERDEREEREAEAMLDNAKTELELWLERKRGPRAKKNA